MELEEIKKEVENYTKNKPKDEGILLVTSKGDYISIINYLPNGHILAFTLDHLQREPRGIDFYQKSISKLKRVLKNKEIK